MLEIFGSDTVIIIVSPVSSGNEIMMFTNIYTQKVSNPTAIIINARL